MSNMSKVTPKETKSIGILLVGLDKLNISVLKFLILQMNALQQTFEYEFLPIMSEDEFVRKLSARTIIDREGIRKAALPFLGRYTNYLQGLIQDYNLKDSQLAVKYFILITLARFDDNYYSLRVPNLSIIALGNWQRYMAPPSIIEFILTLAVRESVSFMAPSLRGSIHLGTRGCICDFTPSLDEARQKVLNGFICKYCCAALASDGHAILADELKHVLDKKWLGNSNDLSTPAELLLIWVTIYL